MNIDLLFGRLEGSVSNKAVYTLHEEIDTWKSDNRRFRTFKIEAENLAVLECILIVFFCNSVYLLNKLFTGITHNKSIMKFIGQHESYNTDILIFNSHQRRLIIRLSFFTGSLILNQELSPNYQSRIALTFQFILTFSRQVWHHLY